MRERTHKIDKPLSLLVALLVIGGALIFASAAFGLLARGATHMSSVAFNHLVLGVGAGLVGLFVTAHIDYRRWKTLAPYLYLLALVATALVFVPGLGASHGGGTRWIIIAGTSFQPSEALKIGAVLMSALYFSAFKHQVQTFQYGLAGFGAILAIPTLLLVMQPDLGTLGIIAAAAFAVYISAGARIRDIAIVVITALLALSALALTRPYVYERVMTFFDPGRSELVEGYQIKQSLIAIGSGGLFGRGFGQGIQKFTYLPEPMGDSIFAVAAEEVGFVGAGTLIALFLLFALRGFAVSARAPDTFGALLGVGISTYLASEAFVNIAAMLGMVPLTGVPLTFASQGGSAMLVSLASVGILLNISRFRRRGSA
jgi:cell division protein FtsW